MRQLKTYKVYITDTDGSERLGGTIDAKSIGHAKSIAAQRGLKNISSVEEQAAK